MAEKPRGNVLYEIAIVILVVALVATILYPSKVWQNEGELEAVCRARMDAIHQMEFRYIGVARTFTDSIPKLKEIVLNEPQFMTALDSIILWEGLIPRKDLKETLNQRSFPQELRQGIRDRLLSATPVGNLKNWDSLLGRLIKQVQESIAVDTTEMVSVDTSVNWQALAGEETFWQIIENPDVSRTVRTRMRTHVRRGQPVQTSSAWDQYKTAFHDALNDKMLNAMREDVWAEDDQDAWELAVRGSWDEEMNLYSQEERDSIWTTLQRRFWDKEKELIWKKERDRLWKEEGETWKVDNEALWDRAISQQWQSERKKEWTEEQEATLVDSTRMEFRAKKDSLWRAIVADLREQEYEDWLETNRKRVDEVMYNLWEVGRRLTWEDSAQQSWLEQKQTNPDELWTAIKEEIWNSEKGRFWREEEEKLSGKENSIRTLDRSVAWVGILGADRTNALVDGLDLPDNQKFWKHVQKSNPEEGSVLYHAGVVDLFRDVLLENVDSCPLAKTSYLIAVNDTATIKKIEIRCPIVMMDGDAAALVIDPVTKDSTYAELNIPPVQKILGGSAIENHGFIDEDMKKSWVRRGR